MNGYHISGPSRLFILPRCSLLGFDFGSGIWMSVELVLVLACSCELVHLNVFARRNQPSGNFELRSHASSLPKFTIVDAIKAKTYDRGVSSSIFQPIARYRLHSEVGLLLSTEQQVPSASCPMPIAWSDSNSSVLVPSEQKAWGNT